MLSIIRNHLSRDSRNSHGDGNPWKFSSFRESKGTILYSISYSRNKKRQFFTYLFIRERDMDEMKSSSPPHFPILILIFLELLVNK